MDRLARLALVLVVLVSGIAHGAPARAETDMDAAKAFVESLADRAIESVAKARDVSDAERVEAFRTLYVDNFDLGTVARFVLGRYWRTASDEQQDRFLDLFTDVMVLTWAGRFKDYRGQTLEVETAKTDGESGAIVQSRVNQTEGDPIKVGWRLRKRDGGFKVIDLTVEGASMALTYRDTYTSVIRNRGGMDALLSALSDKRAQLRVDLGLEKASG